MRLCLRRRFPPLGLHKGILNSPLPPNSLDLHETQNNKMEMQWVAYDQVVCGSSDAVVIRRVVISRHAKVKNFSRTSAGPKQDSATRNHHPTTIKALHSRKIIKLGFLSLPYWFLTESSQYQSWKAKLFPALSGNNLGLSEFKIYGPPIMPLKHKNKGILKHYIPNIKNAV